MLDKTAKAISWPRVRLCLVVTDGFAAGTLAGIWFCKFAFWRSIWEVVVFGLWAAFLAISILLFWASS